MIPTDVTRGSVVSAGSRPERAGGRSLIPRLLPFALLLLAAVLPWCVVPVPVVLGGPVNSVGSLQLLASCLVFAGVAVSYDLLFGRTGLMSFGHALYVAIGAYGADLAMSRLGLGLVAASVLAVVAGTTVAAVLGAVSLRTRALGGIGFAMVTLAFAQAGSVLVSSDPGGITGGEEGLPLAAGQVPAMLIGVRHTAQLYWLALVYLAVCAAIVWWCCGSALGRIWQAIRDNELRVDVLGLNPARYKLGALVLSGALASTGGVVLLLVTAGASPGMTTATFTLSLLVMVVLGGSGTRWGPVVGGIVYTLLDHRLGALGTAGVLEHLPTVLRAPLSQPLVVLGALFIVVVFVLPGGVTALFTRIGHRLTRRSRKAL
ncbi:MAG: branched-chain amino acid ABC transporter permease [Sciscionella sp.]